MRMPAYHLPPTSKGRVTKHVRNVMYNKCPYALDIPRVML